MTVGERIKQRRMELGYTQEELAERMGYKGRSGVCKAETGTDKLLTTKVAKYAEALDCSFAYLMGWDNDSNKEEVPSYDKDTIEIISLLDRITTEQKKTILAMLRSFVN